MSVLSFVSFKQQLGWTSWMIFLMRLFIVVKPKEHQLSWGGWVFKKKSATKLLWLQHPSISSGICILPSVIGKHNLSPFLTGACFWRHSQNERLLRETLPRSGDRWPTAGSWTTRHLVQVRNQQEGGQDHLMFCCFFFFLTFLSFLLST